MACRRPLLRSARDALTLPSRVTNRVRPGPTTAARCFISHATSITSTNLRTPCPSSTPKKPLCYNPHNPRLSPVNTRFNPYSAGLQVSAFSTSPRRHGKYLFIANVLTNNLSAETIVKVPDMAESITEGTLKQFSKRMWTPASEDHI